MATKLIKNLMKCIEQNPSLDILGHQWGFDEKLVPKAMQSIGNLYTHYSLHDESHSKQILVNIERILGDERIVLLSATDTWLLLEAAYWHDSGMVISEEDYEQENEKPEFRDFVESIAIDKHHELSPLCQAYDRSSGCWNIDTSFPYGTMNQFKQLYAEWFRSKHAQRSNNIIQSPQERLGIQSPRTQLIPKRLFLLLGKICEWHGRSFESLVDDINGLPYKEAGIGTDDCHPRYIACLLRLGDLLDLDDNRFCPVMLLQAGKGRPKLSKVHEDKHQSIVHLRIDSRRIEAINECPDIDSYLATHVWFSWIKDEIQKQMANWEVIAPNATLGLLPTIGKLEARLIDKNQQILFSGHRPQFELNKKQAISMLQDLYSDSFICIRELLQNAVDATLIRVFLENKQSDSIGQWYEPGNLDVISKLEQQKIKVLLKPVTQDSNVKIETNITIWELTIEDNGIGISLEDFKHMLQIGGSSKNKNRKTIINSMPEWLKPSGTFGIGFQSVFLLADKVDIETKSIVTGESFKATLHNPMTKMDGLALINSCPTKPIEKFGTKLRVKLKIPNDYTSGKSRSINESFDTFDSVVYFHDATLDSMNASSSAYMADLVTKFSQKSLIPIDGKWIGLSENEEYKIGSIASHQGNEEKWHYNKNAGATCRFKYSIRNNWQGKNQLSYRGQKVDANAIWNFFGIDLCLDLLSSDASYWLTPERDKIRSNDSVRTKLNKLIYECLPEQILQDMSVIKEKIKPGFLSLVATNMYKTEFKEHWYKLYQSTKNEWLEYEIANGLSAKSIVNDYKTIKIHFIFRVTGKEKEFNILRDDKGSTLSIELVHGSREVELLLDLITQELRHKKYCAVVCFIKSKNKFIYKFKKQDKSSHTSLTKHALTKLLHHAVNTFGMNNRVVFPIKGAFNDFSTLKLSEKKQGNLYCFSGILSSITNDEPILVLPMLISRGSAFHHRTRYNNARNEEFYQWLISNKTLDSEYTFHELSEKYASLLEYIDSLMDKYGYIESWKKLQFTRDMDIKEL